jgi:tetratricopeptide (TPR) repeat protein
MHQRLFSGDVPALAWSLHDVGYCQYLVGRPAEGLPKLQAALEMSQRIYGPDHNDIAVGLNSVAVCLGAMGQQAAARERFEAALEMNQRLYPEGHENVAMCLHNVGTQLGSMGDREAALPKLEAALSMWRRLHEGDHPSVARGLDSVGYCLRYMGRVKEALPKLEAALEMRRRLYGDADSRDVAESLNSLGMTLIDDGQAARAEPLLREALDLDRRIYGGPVRHVAFVLHNLADAVRAQGRLPEAERLARESLDMCESHPEWGLNEYRRGAGVLFKILVDANRPAEAAGVLSLMIDMHRRTEPSDDSGLASTLSKYGQLLAKLGSPEGAAQAEPFLRECLEIRTRLLPDDHPQVWLRYNAMSMLGEALCAQAKFAEAEPLLLDGYNGLKDDPRVPPPAQLGGADRKREALERVVQLYEAWAAAEPDDVRVRDARIEWQTAAASFAKDDK